MPASSGSAARSSNHRLGRRTRRHAADIANHGTQGRGRIGRSRIKGGRIGHRAFDEARQKGAIEVERVGLFECARIGKKLADGTKLPAPGGRNGNQGCNAGAGNDERSESGEHGKSLSEDKRAGGQSGQPVTET